MTTSELTVVSGGKLLAAYEGRKGPSVANGEVSAVGAHILERLQLVTRGFIEDEEGEREVAVPRVNEIQRYEPHVLRRNAALFNRNPNNDEDCRSLNGEMGLTVLLTEHYPVNHDRWGYTHGRFRGLGNLMLFDYLMKPYDRSKGTWLIRFPLGGYTYTEHESTYPSVTIIPGFSLDIMDEEYQRARFGSVAQEDGLGGLEYVLGEEPENSTQDFIARDFEREYCTSRIPLARAWVGRIEGDAGSVWQNPNFSTNGLPIKNRHWDR